MFLINFCSSQFPFNIHWILQISGEISCKVKLHQERLFQQNNFKQEFQDRSFCNFRSVFCNHLYKDMREYLDVLWCFWTIAGFIRFNVILVCWLLFLFYRENSSPSTLQSNISLFDLSFSSPSIIYSSSPYLFLLLSWIILSLSNIFLKIFMNTLNIQLSQRTKIILYVHTVQMKYPSNDPAIFI